MKYINIILIASALTACNPTRFLGNLDASTPAEIIKNRSDIRSAEMTVIASSEKVGVAWADRFPTLSLTADGGVASSTLKGLANGSPGIWSVSASLL